MSENMWSVNWHTYTGADFDLFIPAEYVSLNHMKIKM